MNAQEPAADESRWGPVVVVDDDPHVRDSLIILLEIHGFRVRAYSSAGEFLADGRRHGAGCLVIDHHMPGTNGLETIDRLQGEGFFVPIILITGRLDPKLAAGASERGVIAVLEKPFSAPELVQIIHDSLGRAR